MTSHLSTILLVASLVLGGAVAPAAAGMAADTADDTPEPALIVALQADASATVTVRYTYNLSTDAEQNAFQQLRQNESVQDRFAQRFLKRMQQVANATEDSVDRSMTVSNPTIDFRRVDGTGIVTLSITWTNFAASQNGRLVVSEPFADEFDLDRRLVLRPPDGYTTASVTPQPTLRQDASLVWKAGMSLDDFRVVFANPETTTTTEQTTAADTPGFGIAAALLALLGAVFLTRRE